MKSIHLSIVSAVLLFCLALSCNAQCSANAGHDTILCQGLWSFDTICLGGTPTATGGQAPYTYCWERNHYVGSYNFYASLYLDDTTSPNPKLISTSIAPLKFRLTITDSNGCVSFDSVVIKFSYFFIQPVVGNFYIQAGDSVKFNMGPVIGGNFNPLTYLWSPVTGLTDPTDLGTWAKPSVTTFYSLTATDSVGCSVTQGPFYFVYVQTTGIEDPESGLEISISPNPVPSFSKVKVINPSGMPCDFIIYDLSGRLVKLTQIQQNEQWVDVSDVSSGTYLYQIRSNQLYLKSGKLVVN